MAREKLKFKIRLYSTYWDKPPIAEIKINKTNCTKDKFFNSEGSEINLGT